MHKPNHRVSTAVFLLQLPNSPLPSGTDVIAHSSWGCQRENPWLLFPLDLMPLSVVFLFTNIFFLSQTSKETLFWCPIINKCIGPNSRSHSYLAFQFATRSWCLRTEKGYCWMCLVYSTGNLSCSSTESPPRSLPAHHSGPESGAPARCLRLLWWSFALRNIFFCSVLNCGSS